MSKEIRFPFGPAEKISPAVAPAITLPIKNGLTIVKFSGVDDDIDLDVEPAADLNVGARIVIDAEFSDLKTVSFNTGFVAATMPGDVGERWVREFFFDGVEFIAVADNHQIV